MGLINGWLTALKAGIIRVGPISKYRRLIFQLYQSNIKQFT